MSDELGSLDDCDDYYMRAVVSVSQHETSSSYAKLLAVRELLDFWQRQRERIAASE